MAKKDDDELSLGGAVAGAGVGVGAGFLAGCALTAMTGGLAAPLIPTCMNVGGAFGAYRGAKDPGGTVIPGIMIFSKIFGGS